MFPKNKFLRVLIILAAVLAVAGLVWLVYLIWPYVLTALIFLPWLGAALVAGANVA